MRFRVAVSTRRNWNWNQRQQRQSRNVQFLVSSRSGENGDSDPDFRVEPICHPDKKQNEPGTGRIANPRPVSNYTGTETDAWTTLPSNVSADATIFSASARRSCPSPTVSTGSHGRPLMLARMVSASSVLACFPLAPDSMASRMKPVSRRPQIFWHVDALSSTSMLTTLPPTATAIPTAPSTGWRASLNCPIWLS